MVTRSVCCRFLLLVWLILPSMVSRAGILTYAAGIEDSQWYHSASIFECSLTHTIPRFGKGVFYHEAGETLKFYLETTKSPMQAGKAALVLEAPDWSPGRQVRDLGFVKVVKSARPVTVGQRESSNMMAGLLDGLMPTLTRKAWYSEDRIRVRINPVNFSQFYNDYLACVGTLLPVNFRQVERTSLLFKSDKFALTSRHKKALDKVILYVNADKTVSTVFVDGHADASGRRIANRRLSRSRAEAVTAYLVEHGISPDLITTRYHGERYPAASNKTKSDRARNRRATVRLQRGMRNSLPESENPD
ncbi:MAG: hypothetical protein CSB48_01710 [Proteobacteria bacterium]|nr:MAG: hypothetical protein CSB48_01710 [Pseudomonadota bacterium]PIE40229.1 MAG: hypothetical protein CSA51_01745 [Gammaproteobacteria bacterium]